MNRTLVVGCGFLGKRVSELAIEQGDFVFATTRSTGKIPAIEALGAQPIIFDWTDRRTAKNLPDVDRVLVAVSFDTKAGRSSGLDRDAVMVGGLSNLLDVLPSTVPLCYVSTTGVYHQTGGVWVDESSPTRPTRDGGRAHLRAESLLRKRRFNAPATVLRFSGIYGPGRVPRIADVIARRPIASPAEGYLNLIHVEDGARAVLSAWSLAELEAKDQVSNGRSLRPVYLISDDQPMIRADFYRVIAELCGAPDPVFREPENNSPAVFRSETNKRVWNRRMKRDLLPRLHYPTPRAGLHHVLAAYRNPSC